MRKLISIGCLLICLVSFANDIKRVSITYEYISDNPNETPDQAQKTALQRAKLKALEAQFGMDVSGVNAIVQRSQSNGEEVSASNNVFSIAETAVRGEWIETLKETIIDKTYIGGFWHVKVFVEGKARNHTAEKTQIHYAFINNTHDRNHRDMYYDGDDLFLRFSSPVSGSLCVYWIDEEQNAYCLLPNESTTTGYQSIDANTDYLFFATHDDGKSDLVLSCQKEQEQDLVYIVFTPNALTKAHDNESGRNWRDEKLPRQLTYKDFVSWLSKNQTRDENMVVKKEVITIKK